MERIAIQYLEADAGDRPERVDSGAGSSPPRSGQSQLLDFNPALAA
jgi:hypothetical protein